MPSPSLTPCQVGVAKLNNWAAKYTIAGDSSVRKAIVDALQTESEEDSEVLLNLNAVSDKKVESPIGEGSIKLEQLLAGGKDYKSKIVPIYDLKDSKLLVAELKISTTCLASMVEMQKEVDGNLEEKSRATAKSDGQSITLEATKISLDLSALKDKKMALPTHAQLRAELIGLKGASLAPPIAGDAIPLEV